MELQAGAVDDDVDGFCARPAKLGGLHSASSPRQRRMIGHSQMTRAQFNKLFDGMLSPQQAVASGATISGNREAFLTLIGVLDRPDELPVPNIALR